jgi:hypothetical protein
MLFMQFSWKFRLHFEQEFVGSFSIFVQVRHVARFSSIKRDSAIVVSCSCNGNIPSIELQSVNKQEHDTTIAESLLIEENLATCLTCTKILKDPTNHLYLFWLNCCCCFQLLTFLFLRIWWLLRVFYKVLSLGAQCWFLLH